MSSNMNTYDKKNQIPSQFKRHAARLLVLPLLLAIPAGASAGDGNPVKNAVKDVGYLASSPARITRPAAYLALGILGTGALVYSLNGPIRKSAQNIKSARLDGISVQVEKLGGGLYDVALLGILGGAGHLMKNEKLQTTAMLSFESFLAANALGFAAKTAVGLTRPYANQGAARFRPFTIDSVTNSFPSGHTTTAFSIASVFSEQYDSFWVSFLSYGLASAVAMQRVYADRHWASDVFFGAALGTITGRTVVHLARQRAAKRALTIHPYVSPQTANLGVAVKLAF